MREGFVPIALSYHLERLFNFLIGCVVSFDASDQETLIQNGLALGDRMQEAHRAVQGNRPDGTPITWSDAKLMLESDLRLALEYLEEH